MNKVIQSTSRGQVTLPKKWRDKYDTNFYKATVEGDSLIIKPLKSKNFEDSVEEAWGEYLEGDHISQAELMKKYGL